MPALKVTAWFEFANTHEEDAHRRRELDEAEARVEAAANRAQLASTFLGLAQQFLPALLPALVSPARSTGTADAGTPDASDSAAPDGVGVGVGVKGCDACAGTDLPCGDHGAPLDLDFDSGADESDTAGEGDGVDEEVYDGDDDVGADYAQDLVGQVHAHEGLDAAESAESEEPGVVAFVEIEGAIRQALRLKKMGFSRTSLLSKTDVSILNAKAFDHVLARLVDAGVVCKVSNGDAETIYRLRE